MKYIILGLGNPGKEYEGTRHNAGRDAAAAFAKAQKFPEFEYDKKSNSLLTKGKAGKNEILLALPETFMNKSGNTARILIRANPDVKSGPRHQKNKNERRGKNLKELVVLHDDLDIPLGKIKISYGKNSGGHKGVESVMRALKTKNFYRVRVGVCPKNKPGHKELMKFIVGKWKPAEREVFKKTVKKTARALEVGLTQSLDRAMSEFNK